MKKLAIISTHPIQYYAPWFRYLSNEISTKVFYLWDFGVAPKTDRGFGQVIEWDIPLLSGYQYEFIPNASKNPGTHHFAGLNNPGLFKRVERFEPSVVLLMGYNYLSLMRFILAWRWKKSPLLLRGDSHRIVSSNRVKEHFRRRVISGIFKCFSGFLYVGKSNQQYYFYHNVPESKLFFAPHAVDNSAFTCEYESALRDAAAWRTQLSIPNDHAVVLFAGKFESKKRPLDLIEAFKAADQKKSTLLIVGSGALQEEMRARAADHPNIRFAPFQNQTLMPRTYAAADVFVLPSFGPAETWGLAINEAMCMRLPVIVSNHVGCAPDLVRQGSNGWIFPAGNTQALTDCLRDAVADRGRLHEWGSVSREIIQGYSYAEATDGLKRALAQLC